MKIFWNGFEKQARKLTSKARENLPEGAFVFPKERRYPIHDRAHARNALARVAQFGSPSEKDAVRAAVHAKFPDIGESHVKEGKMKSKNEKEEFSKSRALAGTAAAGIAAPFAAVPLVLGGIALDKKMSTEEAEEFLKQVNAKYKGTTQISPFYVGHDLKSQYHPGADLVFTTDTPRTGIFAHELGHAQSMGKSFKKLLDRDKGNTKKILPFLHLVSRHLANPIMASTATGAAAVSGNKKLEDASPFIAGAAFAPTIIEEMNASRIALKDLKKFKGNKAMLRAIPGLAGALSTYVAAPVGVGLAARHFVKKKREAEKKLEGKTKTASFWSGFEKQAIGINTTHSVSPESVDSLKGIIDHLSQTIKNSPVTHKVDEQSLKTLGNTLESAIAKARKVDATRLIVPSMILGAGLAIGQGAGQYLAKRVGEKLTTTPPLTKKAGTASKPDILSAEDMKDPLFGRDTIGNVKQVKGNTSPYSPKFTAKSSLINGRVKKWLSTYVPRKKGLMLGAAGLALGGAAGAGGAHLYHKKKQGEEREVEQKKARA